MKSGGYLSLVNHCTAATTEDPDSVGSSKDSLGLDESGNFDDADQNVNNKVKLKTTNEKKKGHHSRKEKLSESPNSKDSPTLFPSGSWYFPRYFRQQLQTHHQQFDQRSREHEENLSKCGISLALTPSPISSAGSSKSGSSLFVCKVIRKSLGQANRHSLRSKSDNCLHRLARSGSPGQGLATASSFSTRVSCNESFNYDDDDVFEHLGQDPFKSPTNPKELIIESSNNNSNNSRPTPTAKVFSLTRRVFDRVAAFVGPNHSSSLQTSSSSNSSSPKIPKKYTLTKTTSLERHFDTRIDKATTALAREQARRTRSLERNHRHLVTLDSACRYSREVGSHQIDLSNLLDRGTSDLSARYQPDPTFKLRGPSGSPRSFQPADPKQVVSEAHPTSPTSSCQTSVTDSKLLTSSSRLGMSTLITTHSSSSSSIITKPARGWLHPDYLFAKDGINYNVRYVGCLEVNTSMKLLDFDTRSQIAKECISQVCESAGLKSVDNKRRTEKKILRTLSETPSMEKAGENVQLTITSSWIKLSDLDSGQVLFVHDMPSISFASGGDADTLDFVAYVAKNNNVRSCFVMECRGGHAQDVIATIGQAFELRFKEFLKRTPISKNPPLQVLSSQPHKPDDVQYYNDLAGKSQPDVKRGTQRQDRIQRDSSSSNLIDFVTEIPASNGHEYVNDIITNPTVNINGEICHKDPFDMSPFSTQPPGGGLTGLLSSTSKAENLWMQLSKEEWFHGTISRKDAEFLLKNEGDFLVRESQGTPGQYVLTGFQNNSRKHLLLVDPEGVVRTKDRTFDSVSHLIKFHRDNNLPIISADSALHLTSPVVPQSRTNISQHRIKL